MKVVSQTQALPPPESWPENMVECRISGKIIFEKILDSKLCEKNILAVIQNNEKYFFITGLFGKETYTRFHSTGEKPLTTQEKCLENILPKLKENTEYFFTIRSWYNGYQNFAMETFTESNEDWLSHSPCNWSMIQMGTDLGQAVIPGGESKDTMNENLIFFLAILSLIVSLIFLKKYVPKKKK